MSVLFCRRGNADNGSSPCGGDPWPQRRSQVQRSIEETRVLRIVREVLVPVLHRQVVARCGKDLWIRGVLLAVTEAGPAGGLREQLDSVPRLAEFD